MEREEEGGKSMCVVIIRNGCTSTYRKVQQFLRYMPPNLHVSIMAKLRHHKSGSPWVSVEVE